MIAQTKVPVHWLVRRRRLLSGTIVASCHNWLSMARPLRIGAQGRLVLPSAMRRALDIKQGDELAARIEGRRIVLEPRGELLRRMQEELRSARGKRSLVDELITERRRDAVRERAG